MRQFNYYFICCCQHELEQHNQLWTITSVQRLPCMIISLPSSSCVWQGFACYQLYGMIFRPALTGHALTGLVIINGKSKGYGIAAFFFLPHTRFLEQQHVWGRLSQLWPQACQKGCWDLVCLGQGCPRATLEGPALPHFTEIFSPPADLYLELWPESSILNRIFINSSRGLNSSSKPENLMAFQYHCQIRP